MSRTRYDTLTPPTGLPTYPSSVMAAMRFLDIAHDLSDETSTETITDEVVTVAATGLMELDHVPLNGSLAVWGGLGQTGQQFTIVFDDAVFSGVGFYECRHYRFSNRIDFDMTQISGGQVVYATYSATHTNITAALIARIVQELIATQTQVDAIDPSVVLQFTETATAGNNIDDESCYIDSSGLAQPMVTADLTDITKMESAFYCEDTVLTGNTVTFKTAGTIAIPAGLSNVPRGRALWFGKNGALTWDGDPTNGLTTGHWRKFFGITYDGTNIHLNLLQPLQGRQA